MKKKVLIASFFAILMLTVPLSSTIVAEDQISGELQESEEQYLVVEQSNNLIPLTGDEIGYLQDLIDGIGDETTRLLAQAIVNRFITEDGELDTVQLQQVVEEYGTTGLFGGLIQAFLEWLIETISEEVMYQLDGIVTWWFLDSLNSTHLGWLNDLRYHANNITMRLYEIYDVWEDFIDQIQAIVECLTAIIEFLKNPCLSTMGDLLYWLGTGITSALELLNASNFPWNLEEIKELIWGLCNATIEFDKWLRPDEYGLGGLYDRPYNQLIVINGKIVGIDPEDIEFNCDRAEPYFPDDNGSVVMKFNTTDEEREPITWHSVCITVINTTSGDRSHIYQTAFSMGVMNMTFDFTGKPIKPIGPTEVERFTLHVYKTHAIDAEGWNLEYQWSWNGNNGEWSSRAHESGSRSLGLKYWLNLGENEVKVRSRNINNRNEESEWSDPLTVTVHRRFLEETSASQQLQTFVMQTIASIPNSQSATQPSSQSTTTQQSTTSS